jgi:hypothetical protein
LLDQCRLFGSSQVSQVVSTIKGLEFDFPGTKRSISEVWQMLESKGVRVHREEGEGDLVIVQLIY